MPETSFLVPGNSGWLGAVVYVVTVENSRPSRGKVHSFT